MKTPSKTAERCARLAQLIALELGRSFKYATMEETLEPGTMERTIMFRHNTDGTITFASTGLLPTIWRENATLKVAAMFEAWLEGIKALQAARTEDRVG